MNVFRDLRHGVRILGRHRRFALAAVSVVALGIGATTAVFSVVRGVLLTPLPYRDPGRIVLFRADLPGYARQAALIAEELFALRDRTDLFGSVSVINASEGNFTAADVMAAANAVSINDNFFETLGVPLLLGRSVNRSDVGTEWVTGVDISYEAWQRHFHGDRDIVGRTIEINNLPMTVVGVLPRAFRLPLGAGVAIPTTIDIWYPRAAGYERDPFRGRVVIARVKNGVSIEAVQAAVNTIATQLVAQFPARYKTGAVRLSAGSLGAEVVSDVKPALAALAAAVAIVLLVACANLAMLLLTRASARGRELAVRTSIGATRGQIVEQLLSEGVAIGGLGAAAGLLLAKWGVDALLLLAPESLPRREAIAIDGAVAAFAIGVSLLAVLAASLVPVWQAAGADVAQLLKQDARARRTIATRGLLVAAQLALSLVLLVAAGLMARAFVKMRAVPLGFEPRTIVAMDIALGLGQYRSGPAEAARLARLDLYRRLARSVEAIPGVERLGFGFPVPMSGTLMNQIYATAPDAPQRQAEGIIALGGFLETLRVPLVAGRYFTAADDDRPVAIVDERLALEAWPGRSAIGQRLLLSRLSSPVPVEVVGVVSHVQTQPLRASSLPQIWMTYASRSYGLSIAVRGIGGAGLAQSIERAVQALGPGRPVHDVRFLSDAVADASSDTRFALFVLGTFAVLALVLTAVGVYASVAYATSTRTREIAVRRALGAEAAGIVTLVVRESAVWTVGGLVSGVAGAFAVSRYLESLLFHVGARDPLTFVVVPALLGVVALAATIVPALSAVRVDPMLALRSE